MKELFTSDNIHEVYETAKRKARYGHRDWLVWIGRDGKRYAAPRTAESLKAALLASGTQGKFSMYCANDAQGWNIGWWHGVIMFKNARGGWM